MIKRFLKNNEIQNLTFNMKGIDFEPNQFPSVYSNKVTEFSISMRERKLFSYLHIEINFRKIVSDRIISLKYQIYIHSRFINQDY